MPLIHKSERTTIGRNNALKDISSKIYDADEILSCNLSLNFKTSPSTKSKFPGVNNNLVVKIDINNYSFLFY